MYFMTNTMYFRTRGAGLCVFRQSPAGHVTFAQTAALLRARWNKPALAEKPALAHAEEGAPHDAPLR